MVADMKRHTINYTYWFFCLLIIEIFVGSFLHEAAHWLAGELLGYDMQAGIGSARPVGVDQYRSVFDWQVVNIAGPAFTLFAALVGFVYARYLGAAWGYTLVFAAWYQRLLAAVISGISRPNDEARFSILLGWEWWVVPALMVAVLSTLLWLAGRRHNFGWKANVLFYVGCSIGYSLVVFADGQFPGFRHASPVLLP